MNRFDRVLWRINGILFLVTLVAGAALTGWGILQTFWAEPRYPKGGDIVNETPDTHEKEVLNFGSASTTKGASVTRIPLYGEITSRDSFSSKGGGTRIHNYLYLDHSDLSSRWLFEGHHRIITVLHDLRAEAGRNESMVIGSVYEVITADTDGDHRLTSKDSEAAFFSGPDGKGIVEIVSPSDRILSVDQVSNAEVLILYQRGSVRMAALFSVKDGSKLKESAFPSKEQ